MEEAVSIAPNKRRKLETDCQLCIICQVNTHDEPLVENPQVKSIETVLNVSGQRHRKRYNQKLHHFEYYNGK